MPRVTEASRELAGRLAGAPPFPADVEALSTAVQGAREDGLGPLPDCPDEVGHWRTLWPYMGRGGGKSADVSAVGLAIAGFGSTRLPEALRRLAMSADADILAEGHASDPVEAGERYAEALFAAKPTDGYVRGVLDTLTARSCGEPTLGPEEDVHAPAHGRAVVRAAIGELVELEHGESPDAEDVARVLGLPEDDVSAVAGAWSRLNRAEPMALSGVRLLDEVDPATLVTAVRLIAACVPAVEAFVPLADDGRRVRQVAAMTVGLLPVLAPLARELPGLCADVFIALTDGHPAVDALWGVPLVELMRRSGLDPGTPRVGHAGLGTARAIAPDPLDGGTPPT